MRDDNVLCLTACRVYGRSSNDALSTLEPLIFYVVRRIGLAHGQRALAVCSAPCELAPRNPGWMRMRDALLRVTLVLMDNGKLCIGFYFSYQHLW